MTAELRSWEQRPYQRGLCRSCRKAPHWKCFLLTFMIVGCMAAIGWCRLSAIHRYRFNNVNGRESSPCDDGYVYIPSAFVIMLYLVYLVECWHCHTRVELRYRTDIESVYERIRLLREAKPNIWWKAECYHYVRRTRQITRYRNGDAFTSIQVYYERVNTYTATSSFDYQRSGVKDISKNLKGLEDFPIVKIKFTKGFSFACIDAEREFEDERFGFFQENDRRDDFMQSYEGLELGHCDFKDFLVAFADTDRLPWYVTQAAFWLCSLVLLSWPLRVLIEYKTAEVDFIVHKVFGLNYISEFNQSIPRTITMGSSEMEFNISNNTGIVPSYSEAILMECANNPPRWTSDVNGNITPTVTPSKSNGFGFYYSSYGSVGNGLTSGKGGSFRRVGPRVIGTRYVSTKSEPDLFAHDISDFARNGGKPNKKKQRLKPPRRSQSSMSTLGATALSPDTSTLSLQNGEQPPSYDLAVDMNGSEGTTTNVRSPSVTLNFGRLPNICRRNTYEDCEELLSLSDELSQGGDNQSRDTMSRNMSSANFEGSTQSSRPYSVHVTSHRIATRNGTEETLNSPYFQNIETRL